MKYLMTKRRSPALGYLIIDNVSWEGDGYCCGWYNWCGYKNATIVAKYFYDENKIKVVNNVGELIEDVYDDYGSTTVKFETDTQTEAVNKFIDFISKGLDD